MKTNPNKISAALFAFLLGALPLGNALAEDIEIYVGADSNLGGVQPNILFVIDTSGSMSGLVASDQAPYDPSVNYGGSCISTHVYWDDDASFPNCNTGQYIETTSFHCQAALDAFVTTGYFQDRYGSWRDSSGTRNDYWTDVSSRFTTRLTDCKTDSGVHGNGGAELYAANFSSGPWSSTAGDEINWDNREVLTFMSGNYMNWWNNPPARSESTRLNVVQEVTKTLLDSVANVNFGLMRYSDDSDGGMILFPIADVVSNRTAMKTTIDSLKPLGGTPLSETYYEAIQYYRGSDVDFGLDSKADNTVTPSVAESRGNGDSDLLDAGDDFYKSPVEFQCQKNFIVYLTDGEPTSDSQAGAKIKALPGFAGSGTCSNSINGDCLEEAAYYARNRDLMPSISGDQNVITYVVGFDVSVDKLTDTATQGGGKFYLADDSQSLLTAFTNIVSEILAINTTFTAPAVSVNAFNRTVHLNQLFFTVFKPSEKPHWNGNMKRFDIGFENVGDTEVQILDSAGNPAVDPNTGFFKDTAISFWTNIDQSPDGGEAALGGAAGDLVLPRDVYTYTGTVAALTDTTNAFHEDNTLITKAALGIDTATDAYRTTLLQWARGVDTEDVNDDGIITDIRRIMGDPLHSKPAVVTYGGTAADPDFTVFMTTNDGFLHAIDGRDGSEYFAFIPQQQWSKLDTLYADIGGTGTKVYGLDSPITSWVHDQDNDGIIEPATDHVYLYFGERRGGGNYYALDVTDRAAPEFLWRIDDSTTGYGELAQTWASPRLARINVGGTVKDVLIFGGGYDPDQDVSDLYSDDDEGRAIFIADAVTGAVIWWAGPTGSGANLELADLRSSIPADIRVVDVNGDGLHDRMYAGDMGGRLFRFDIINGQAVATLVTGGKIASLGGGDLVTPTIAASRKFFEPPDAALIVDEENGNYINIAIGSGNRAHPLDTDTQNAFFAVRDPNVFNVPASYAYGITIDTMFNATDNVIGEGTEAEKDVAIPALNASDGWYIYLVNAAGTNEGEKVLAEATTLQGKIFFTTFTPVAAAQSSSCAPSQGLAKAYVVDAKFATPVDNLDGFGSDDALTSDDRSVTLTRGGIPPEVTILFPEATDGAPIGLVGPEDLPIDITNPPVRTYWYEADTDTE